MNPAQIADWLREFAHHHNLMEQATEACWKIVRKLLATENDADAKVLQSWGLDKLETHLDKHSLVVQDIWLTYPFVNTQIGLYAKDESGFFIGGLVPIGTYTLRTKLDGQFDDDFFVLEKSPGGDFWSF